MAGGGVCGWGAEVLEEGASKAISLNPSTSPAMGRASPIRFGAWKKS